MKPYDDCIHCGGRVDERLECIDYRYHGQLFILGPRLSKLGLYMLSDLF